MKTHRRILSDPNAGVPKLSREQIERKAETVLSWFHRRPWAYPQVTPLAEIIARLSEKHRVRFSMTDDLGFTKSGQKMLGAFIRKPLAILVDRSLNPNGPRWRFTLAHELGHLSLHRKLNLNWDNLDNRISDDRRHIHRFSNSPSTPREWLEWQANAFAEALLMPRCSLRQAIAERQKELGINRNVGTIYVDDEWHNVQAYIDVVRHLQFSYQTSKSMVIARLKRLELLTDRRRFNATRSQNLLAQAVGDIIRRWEHQQRQA